MLVNTSTIVWQLGDALTSATKGLKSAPASDQKGNPVSCTLTTVDLPLAAPFSASAYNAPTALRQTAASDATNSSNKQWPT